MRRTTRPFAHSAQWHIRKQAGGELFNGDGKTDILVRVDGRNVFIAECKIWNGPKNFNDAIDQLSDIWCGAIPKQRSSSLSNTRTPGTVIEKAYTALREHANFKRAGVTSL
jgi:hypothetical protein